jgi:hypothetical protein
MRAILSLLLGSALLVGCQHPKPSDPNVATGETVVKKGRTTKSSSKPAASRDSGVQPQATPLNESSGKVASVNPTLRFVVIDFSLNPLPKTDQQLGVYRKGQKVGEVKISAQARNSIVAADITDGDAQVGDEVRPD